jgi:hypothetical protein
MLDVRNVALLLRYLMHVRIVITFIGAEVLLHGRTRHGYGKDQVIGRPFVMLISAGDLYGQRRAALINQDMHLAAQLGAIGRVLTGLRASQGSGTRFAIERLPFPADVPLMGIEAHARLKDGFPETLLLPSLKPIMQYTARDTKPVFVDSLPLAACPQDIPNAVQDGVLIYSGASRATVSWRFRQKLLDPTPQAAWDSEESNVFRFCAMILAQGVYSLPMGCGNHIYSEIRPLTQLNLISG